MNQNINCFLLDVCSQQWKSQTREAASAAVWAEIPTTAIAICVAQWPRGLFWCSGTSHSTNSCCSRWVSLGYLRNGDDWCFLPVTWCLIVWRFDERFALLDVKRPQLMEMKGKSHYCKAPFFRGGSFFRAFAKISIRTGLIFALSHFGRFFPLSLVSQNAV